MIGMTAALEAAQQSSSPRYAIAVTAGPRSSAWQTGGGDWQKVSALPTGLSTWNQQSIATDAAVCATCGGGGAAGAMRLFLSWKEGKVACQFVTGDLAASATWTAATVRSVATFTAVAGIDAPKPALIFENGRWHAFYRLPDGNIYGRVSSDNGVTWGAATTVYGGGDAAGDLFAIYLATSDLHVLHFSTLTDTWRMRGAARLGYAGAWNVWATHGSATGWLPAGLAETGARSLMALCVADTAYPFEHYTAAVGVTLNADGTLSNRDVSPTVLWLVSGDGAIRPRHQAVGSGFGGWLHTCQDGGANRLYACAGGLDVVQRRLEEPAALTGEALGVSPLERHWIPLQVGGDTLLVGLAQVVRSAAVGEDVSVGVDEVVAYRYEVDEGGGLLTLEAKRGSALESAQPGWGLWLTRRCAKGSSSGEGTVGLRVVSVETRSDGLRITALDALGELAAMRARRPLQFTDYAFTLQHAAEALVAWAGLVVDASATLDGDAPLFQWQGGESGLAALRRLLRDVPVTLRSRIDGVGEATEVAICAPEQTVVYTYGAGGHPLIARALEVEARSPRLVVVHGLTSRNDPSQGEDWALEVVGDALSPMARARPLYYLNRGQGQNEQPATAAGLAQAVRSARRAGWFEAQANLALEIGDLIEVEGGDYRVEGIVEEWRERRLVQRVSLGPG